MGPFPAIGFFWNFLAWSITTGGLINIVYRWDDDDEWSEMWTAFVLMMCMGLSCLWVMLLPLLSFYYVAWGLVKLFRKYGDKIQILHGKPGSGRVK